MVQELDWVYFNSPRQTRASRWRQAVLHPTQTLKYLHNAAIPILFRKGEGDLRGESLKLTPVIEEAFYLLATQVKSLRENAQTLEDIDPLTVEVTKQLDIHCKGIIFERFGNDESLRINLQNQYLSLNLDTVLKLAQGISCKVPKEAAGTWVGIALTVFLCHEISHASQGLRHYRDVQRMKSLGESFGRARMGELDLRSDFLVAHTLSYNFALEKENFPNQRAYIRYFYKIWCQVCKMLVESFPTDNQKNINRKDKQQRMFGYLLMSNLTHYAYEGNRELEFNAELWPEWSDSLDELGFLSGGCPRFPGSSVNPETMRQILNDISQGQNSSASLRIEEIWRNYPRR